jgi:hypothetical protein
MATEGRVPATEQATNPEETQILRTFTEQYLLPKTLALIERGLEMDFFDQLNGGLPEVVPPLVDALSRADDPDARITAGYQAEAAAMSGGPDFYKALMNRLVEDVDPEVANLAQLYLRGTAERDKPDRADITKAARELRDEP